MPALVLVPFDGGPTAQATLRAAGQAAREERAMVAALYVVRVPRQLPLSAELPWLTRDVARVQASAEPIIRETGADAWVEWVIARDLGPAIADVAAELHATRIVLGVRGAARHPAWLARWSLAERLLRLASCPVTIHDASVTAPVPQVATSAIS